MPDQHVTAQAFSVGEEKEIGEQLLAVVRKEFKVLDDPDISQYINNLGQEILKVTGPQYFDFHFFVIDNKTFNAFAAPSGLIFFHTGLIETMDSEDELISVLAHEIAHVQSRHIAGRIEKSSKISLATLALIIAGIAAGDSAISEALITGGMAAGTAMSLSYSRKDEEEADRFAYKWLKESSHDPHAMVDMLRKMYRVSRLHRNMVPPYLLTHPDPAQRLDYVQNLLLMNDVKENQDKDDFAFQRIKYRILSKTKDAGSLLIHYKKQTSKIKDLNKQSVMPYYGLALAYADNVDYANAAKALEKVIQIYPEEPILLTDLGFIRFHAGQNDEALALLEKSRKADSNNAYTTYYLARAYDNRGDKKKALAYFEELLRVLPTYPRLRYNIGKIKAFQGKKGEGHYYLGIYHWQEGESKNAIYHLNKAIKNLKTGNKYRLESEKLLAKIQKITKK